MAGDLFKAFKEPVFVTRPVLPDLKQYTARLEQIWESKWLTNQWHQHEMLEDRLAGTLKVPLLSLFNNGTTALMLACKSLRITGEVITTPFTFPATPHVLTWNNVKPLFCDIHPVTMNIDAEKIESMITSQTTAILGVHVFGTPCEVKKIQEVADLYGLKVIYDAAHAFGVEIDGVGIGNFGDITMFSFHATKLFHTAEGGALTFKDPLLKNRLNLLKNFGIKGEEEVVMPGINGKMNELQAALGLTILDIYEEERRKRKVLVQKYRQGLKDVQGITCLQEFSGIEGSFQYFCVRINEEAFGKSRDYVYEELKKYNIYTRKYFYPLCSQYNYYGHLPSASLSNLPVARRVVKEILTLPLYGELSGGDVEAICEILIHLGRGKL
ncbi:DegT/DnrJ/EryC1/StrS family aminotransferase [Candidatus Contubernalis alkaliaceticus]|uniref:DegT/DnrJ/EryC1/StrS family aminotransferase n=1 Tax=Candidatus Contubernalis alkaliaceticus TaxID=338645 RepID=UPI001F4BEF0B|nr:DegT/DnrJ/EryC1/StrS family aminotransferase [Candidatus Contubernalis alkalaceticus]UNC93588.1 DegT/DnrJ/EryC1/StrS family aminotransferase [Candidatus Contubernalis alkalaceticus]